MSKTRQKKDTQYSIGYKDGKSGKQMRPPKNLSQCYIAGYKESKKEK